MTAKFPLDVRDAFKALPDEASHIATQEPDRGRVFTPENHQGALDPHRSVVVGDRGTGKSFWSSVLISPGIRNVVASRYPRLGLNNVDGRLGFSNDEMKAGHPVRSEIAAIIGAGHRAEDLWRGVLLRLAPFRPAGAPADNAGWQATVDWVAADPARRNTDFRTLDETLIKAGKTYVLVVDALDVIADNWDAIRTQMEGLIRLALAVRALQAVRVKLFIRPDMADDRRLWAVGDASKLRHNEVTLAWKRRDLYGLLWTLLATSSGAAESAARAFREHCASAFGMRFEDQDGSWRAPRELVEDEDRQQEVFHALAGEWMGADRRRGDTYRWVPNHLSNSQGYAAPRSFLLAMRDAATRTTSLEAVLDRGGIESGARVASKTRHGELSEDYRWMDTALNAMEHMIVPIPREELIDRWCDRRTLQALRDVAGSANRDRRFIPPGDVLETDGEREAYAKLIEQLIRLNIMFRLSDGRINMPDLFRLQANIKRRGGMKPRA